LISDTTATGHGTTEFSIVHQHQVAVGQGHHIEFDTLNAMGHTAA
jgi:hypothetical protein